jgi:hypothetical protein
MDWDTMVPRAGDQVRAWGRLVTEGRETWFEPPLPVPLMMIHPQPVNRPRSEAVPVAGADFDAVADRYELDGEVEGWATVTGTWTGHLLRIEQQTASRPSVPDDSPKWQVPPCPPPPGGWPQGIPPSGRGLGNLDFEVGDLEESGAAVTVATFRPGRDQAVLVVAAADPTAVEARLRPQLGSRLCVVPSRWTKSELDAVRGHLHDRFRDWRLYGLCVDTLDDAQARVRAQLTMVTPKIASWAASLPPGILRLDSWLLPVRPASGDK